MRIKHRRRFCYFPDPLVIMNCLLCHINSCSFFFVLNYFYSWSIVVLFRYYNLNILVPLFPPLCDQSRIVFSHMIQLSTVCARHTKIQTISHQIARIVILITYNWSSSPTSESSSSSFILSPRSIILWYSSFRSFFSLNSVCIHNAFSH
jgi:hypothetical protein